MHKQSPGFFGAFFIIMHTSNFADKEKNRAALTSLVAAAVLTSIKLAVGLYTNSLGILSEALHSGLDLLAAFMTLAAVRIAARPADENHAYGHGKIENLSALAETVLLLVTCGWIMIEVVERLFFDAQPVLPSLWGVAVMAVSITVDVNRSRMLRRIAKKHRSQALEADALHFMSDIWSSAVVLVGLLAVWCAQWVPENAPVRGILESADAVAAFLVSLIILKASYDLAKRSINELLDGGSFELRSRIETAVQAMPDVNSVRRVRIRHSGAQTFVDLVVCVDPRLRVEDGHHIAHKAEQTIRRLIPDVDVTVHVESHAGEETANPLIIIQNTAAAHEFSVHGLQLLAGMEGLRVELHAEMPGRIALKAAHRRVTAFEAALSELLPGVKVVTHLEPEDCAEECRPREATPEELMQLETALQDLVQEMGSVSGCHRLIAYRLPGEADNDALSVCFHCRMHGNATVEQAHQASLRLEHGLRRRMPLLGRIVVHMEPEYVAEDRGRCRRNGQ